MKKEAKDLALDREAARSKLEKRWPNHAELRKTIARGVECRFLVITDGYVPASCCLIATTPGMGFPIGTVWYALRESSTVCEILTSYVEPWARRLGVRTALHRSLIVGYPTVKTIVTDSSLSKASRKWMKSKGYKKSAAGWRLDVKRKER